MTTEHPITPPPELVEQWATEYWGKGESIGEGEKYIATQAARWGADQELEACCEYMQHEDFHGFARELRQARRPKPPSLAEQALEACERSAFGIPGDRDIIRAALERLQELEKGNE